MTDQEPSFRFHWREVLTVFLRLGSVSFGGPAIMGIMQTEIQERRAWLSKTSFVEGLGIVSMLPGPTATQLAIFLGYGRAGWWGGLLAGICFLLPALVIMLALTLVYDAYGELSVARQIFYGLSPVVIAIFAFAVYRLGRSAIKDMSQIMIALLSALVLGFTAIGIIPILLVAGAVGIAWYRSLPWGFATGAIVLISVLIAGWVPGLVSSSVSLGAGPPGAWDVGLFFLKVGGFTFGGGLTVLAFMQEQVVNELHWLTPQEFLDGLALGQLTPGPILMLAAFVGYRVDALTGAAAGALGIFLPAFILMLSLLPFLEHIKRIEWMKAALKGISPAVIGVSAMVLLQMLPAGIKDGMTVILALAALVALWLWRIGPLGPLLVGGIAGFFLSAG